MARSGRKDRKGKAGKGSGRKQAPDLSSTEKGSSGAKPGLLGRLVGGWNRENGLEWVRSIGIAVFLALLIRWPLAEPFKIPSGSMKPTFYAGDRIFVNKYVYGVRFPFNGFRFPFTRTTLWYSENRIWSGAAPERWDIVVFKSVEAHAEHDTLVKRIVALPGERVRIRGGKVFIDGVAQELPASMPDVRYTSPYSSSSPMRYGILDDEAYSVVPEDCYLVLGDNSGSSRDGRYFGWLPNQRILGRVSSIWWPIRRWKDLTGFSGTIWWNSLVWTLGILAAIRLFLGRSWRIYTEKIGSTFASGEHVFVNRIALGFPVPFTRYRLPGGRAPRRGEIVLYHRPRDATEGPDILLGRVAGLPGERVFLDGGALRVNDTPVREPASLGEARFSGEKPRGPYGRSKGREHSLVPEGHFFVLVDDAVVDDPDSPDSRDFGWVSKRNVIGTVTAVWWPIWRWRRIRSG